MIIPKQGAEWFLGIRSARQRFDLTYITKEGRRILLRDLLEGALNQIVDAQTALGSKHFLRAPSGTLQELLDE